MAQSLTGYAILKIGGDYDVYLPHQSLIIIMLLNFGVKILSDVTGLIQLFGNKRI
jgi:hypothetical protein